MMDDLLEERRQLLELLILIAAISVVTAWLASRIQTLPLRAQELIIALVVIAAGIYLSRTPLFDSTRSKRVEVPLSYDAQEKTFLVPVHPIPTGIVHPMDRLWNEWKSSETEDDLPFSGGDLSLLYEMVEFGIIAVWSQRYNKSWQVETHEWTHGHGRSMSYGDVESQTMSIDDLKAAFADNRFFQVDVEENDGEGASSVIQRALRSLDEPLLHLPPDTEIKDLSARDDEPQISIVIENPYIRVHLHNSGYSGGHGPLSHKGMTPGDFFNRYRDQDEIDTETYMAQMDQFRHAIIRIRASIEPKGLRVLGRKAPEHWRWAEDLVDSLQEAADYPTENLTRINYD